MKWILILAMAASGYSKLHFYKTFTVNGSNAATPIDTVEINDHGSIVYITQKQSCTLTILTTLSISCFFAAILIDLYQRKHYPSQKT